MIKSQSLQNLMRSKHLFVYKVYLHLLHIKFNFYLIPLRSNKALYIAQNILTMGPKYLQTKATHTPNFFLLSSEQSVYVLGVSIQPIFLQISIYCSNSVVLFVFYFLLKKKYFNIFFSFQNTYPQIKLSVNSKATIN